MDDPSAVRILVDCRSLERGSRGPIWGRVCVCIGNTFFPEGNWTDIAAAFCLAWLRQIHRLASRDDTSGSVFFMDGPFRVDFNRSSADSIELRFVDFRRGDSVEYRCECATEALLQDAASCAQFLVKAADEKGWSDDLDIKSLRAELEIHAQ